MLYRTNPLTLERCELIPASTAAVAATITMAAAIVRVVMMVVVVVTMVMVMVPMMVIHGDIIAAAWICEVFTVVSVPSPSVSSSIWVVIFGQSQNNDNRDDKNNEKSQTVIILSSLLDIIRLLSLHCERWESKIQYATMTA